MKAVKIILFLIPFLLFFVSCSNESKKETDKTTNEMNSQMQKQMEKKPEIKSDLIREGEIDVAVIDENGDGKVYECPMDWNVISDHPGDCPVCGMHLKEFSLADTKANLQKYGYKIKN